MASHDVTGSQPETIAELPGWLHGLDRKGIISHKHTVYAKLW